TPTAEPRRYDTRFFVAALPYGQVADGQTTEAAEVEWSRPADAIARWRRGESLLLPPTWAQLEQLCGFESVSEVLAAHPRIDPIMPEIVSDGAAAHIEFPGQSGYYGQ
ncbi:MAG: NUDIX hydrolase, partial [Rhodococcus sp.]|nr:NUDIX hydrolase [Rhodococcus sp. (in: high G+C Gram-positive bacteria)]